MPSAGSGVFRRRAISMSSPHYATPSDGTGKMKDRRNRYPVKVTPTLHPAATRVLDDPDLNLVCTLDFGAKIRMCHYQTAC